MAFEDLVSQEPGGAEVRVEPVHDVFVRRLGVPARHDGSDRGLLADVLGHAAGEHVLAFEPVDVVRLDVQEPDVVVTDLPGQLRPAQERDLSAVGVDANPATEEGKEARPARLPWSKLAKEKSPASCRKKSRRSGKKSGKRVSVDLARVDLGVSAKSVLYGRD